MAARSIVAGTAETLSANREKAIKAFATFGVTPDQIFEALGVDGEREIKTDHIATLRAMFATLKNGEGTVEEMFGKSEPDHKLIADPLNDDGPAPRGTIARQAAADHVEGEYDETVKDKQTPAAAEPEGGRAEPAADTPAAAQTKPAGAAPEPAGQAAEPEIDPEQGEPPTAAYTAGREARRKGLSGRTVPDEFASDPDAAADWAAGWKEENAAQKAGGGK
jgi:hypothetical protein